MICVIVGAQWGDEGKGKMADFFSSQADYIVRYQGGNNAGHTVIFGDQTFKLHHIPSGICQGKICVIGNGVVLNPMALLEEITALENRHITVRDKLFLSDRLHLILPHHMDIDGQEETQRTQQVGTTRKGIGPAYTDKYRRTGIRLGDWQNHSLPDHLRQILSDISPMITDTTALLHQVAENGEYILLEGAQGTFLDIDHGTYPYVTSSSPTSGGACTGSGLPPTAIDRVVGILKAYTTRVGNGPFPTETTGTIADFLQTKGVEVGTTTGRTRRCGWLDLVMANYARQVNGLSGWILTKLDVLSELDEIQVCTGYQKLTHYPSQIQTLESVQPIYQTLPGWKTDIANCRHYNELPPKAKEYITFIEEKTSIPVDVISVGPERNQTLVRRSIWK